MDYQAMRRGLTVLVGSLVLLWGASAVGQRQCPGDLNGDNQVTVDELITAVSYALDGCPPPGPRFVDNGDGTITDNETGLMWEKKDDAGGIHDWDNSYRWSERGTALDGSVATVFLAELNTPPCFAGHCDWRLPNVHELQSIIDYERFEPAVDPVFDNGCTEGCTATSSPGPECSCTQSSTHWSATTHARFPDSAWFVYFNFGGVTYFTKTHLYFVRAVRSGFGAG